jgi:hypothetical protein
MEEDEADKGIWHVWGDNSKPQIFGWEIPNETDLFEDLFVVGSITLISILNKQDGRKWPGIV